MVTIYGNKNKTVRELENYYILNTYLSTRTKAALPCKAILINT